MQCSALLSETLYYSMIRIPDCLYIRSMVEYASFICNPSGTVQINRIEVAEKVFEVCIAILAFY